MAREAWIRKYTGTFGERSQLAAYRAREISFNMLYHLSTKIAENMVTKVQNCPSEALDGE